ncbi:MAG: radical SAM protein [Bacteroidota bacterium]|nr:radical SAM protein [Bacteroidota bacterium]
MTKKNRTLLLINPMVKTGMGLQTNIETRYQPIGLAIIAALTPSNWKIKILDENFRDFRYYPADLVAFTAFTATAFRAYELAKIYREKGIPTVIGGIHPSLCPEEARQYVDTVVIGEAESIWPKVLEDFEKGQLKREYRGEMTSVIRQPVPRRDLLFPGYYFATIQTSRGCPMNCSFCSVTAFNGNRYRYRPLEDVIEEWKVIPQDYVAIADDNLVGNTPESQKRAIELFKAIESTGLKKKWIGQVALNAADNEEVLRAAARSGCKLLFLGVETENVEQLKYVNKKINMKMGVESYNRVFRKIQKHGIGVIAGFMFGWPTDTPQTIEDRIKFILRCQASTIQISIMTPLPGTALYTQLKEEGRIVHNNPPQDWPMFDASRIVYNPYETDREELERFIYDKIRRIYEPAHLKKKFYMTWLKTRKLSTAYISYMSYNFLKDVLYGHKNDGNIKWVEWMLHMKDSDPNKLNFG